MGNRAVITTKDKKIGVYIHHNGGRDCVEGFLTYCKLKKFRPPETDNYGWAYLCQVIGNYFGNGLSVGIDRYCNLDTDNGDNGVYVIEKWEIVDRIYQPEHEEDGYNPFFLYKINSCQPKNLQIDIPELDIYEKNLTDFDGQNKVNKKKEEVMIVELQKEIDVSRKTAEELLKILAGIEAELKKYPEVCGIEYEGLVAHLFDDDNLSYREFLLCYNDGYYPLALPRKLSDIGSFYYLGGNYNNKIRFMDKDQVVIVADNIYKYICHVIMKIKNENKETSALLEKLTGGINEAT